MAQYIDVTSEHEVKVRQIDNPLIPGACQQVLVDGCEVARCGNGYRIIGDIEVTEISEPTAKCWNYVVYYSIADPGGRVETRGAGVSNFAAPSATEPTGSD